MNPETRKRLEELRRRAEKAVGRAVAQERRLFANGVPVHPEDRHFELLRGIRSERNAVLSAVRREAQEIEREQRELLERTNAALSPSDSLAPHERADAERQLRFANAEIRNLTPTQLRARLEALAANGSRVERFAWTVAAAAHERELLSRRGDRTQTANPSFSTALDKLQTALLGPLFEERTQHVQEALDAAEELAKFAYVKARGAESYAGAYRRTNSAIAPLAERQKYLRGGQPPAPAVEPPSRPDSDVAAS